MFARPTPCAVRFRKVILSGLLVALLSAPALAFSEKPVSAPPLTFEQHIRPLLKTHCFHCHGEDPAHTEGGLDTRLVRWIREGGDSGPALIPGDPDDSYLLSRIESGEMPPDKSLQLSPEEQTLIRRWIQEGAVTARPEPETDRHDFLITDEERTHWAWQPFSAPEVPAIPHSEQIRQPPDAFLLARLVDAGFEFAPRATPEILIRRVWIDLLGLPPSPDELDHWVSQLETAGSRDQTWAALVDHLLDDPRYGERWAQHWLDTAGYADSEGYNDADTERPHAWRYRDYVIRAFNTDLPIDRFITEQLAGDELVTSPRDNLSATDAGLLAATGFLRMAPDGTGGKVSDPGLARNETIADTIEIVTSTLLGATVACAQCHDHRYDPISQRDYYELRAVFDPVFNWKSWKSPNARRVSLYNDADRAAAAAVEERARAVESERTQQQNAAIRATFENELAKLPENLRDQARAARDAPAEERTGEQKTLLKKYPSLNVSAGSLYLYDKKAADRLKQLADQAAAIRKEKPAEGFVRAAEETADVVPVSHIFYRGDHDQPREEVTPAGLTVISQNSTSLPAIPNNNESLRTTGRRLAFAQRLTDPRHPLTSRVFVNRIWMHHFGRGLVTTPSDFGRLGQAPTHPDLLDWLAADFMQHGWSLKRLHRMILTSTAWQQAVRTNQDLITADPDNRLYGGAALVRLDAEALRDSLLAVSGKLNPKTGGPPIPVMADKVGRFIVGQENLNAGRPGDVIDLKGEQFRRSIYIQTRRSRPLSVLAAFDLPEMAPNCDRRRQSTNAVQSLLMMNSDTVIDAARRTAERIQTEGGSDPHTRITYAWKLIYSRSASTRELNTALEFLTEQTAILSEFFPDQPPRDQPAAATASDEALACLCQVLLSSNRFLYIE